mgnify:CR=1 FL=1
MRKFFKDRDKRNFTAERLSEVLKGFNKWLSDIANGPIDREGRRIDPLVDIKSLRWQGGNNISIYEGVYN